MRKSNDDKILKFPLNRFTKKRIIHYAKSGIQKSFEQ